MPKIALTIPIMSPKCLLGGMMSHLSYGWPDDFHADFYSKLHTNMQRSRYRFGNKWWTCRVDDLRGWAALRPLSNSQVINTGSPHLSILDQEYRKIIHNGKTSINSCNWNDAAGLFNEAAKIKVTKGNSPAFASKLCHFILPGLFPVMDTESLTEARSALRFGNDYQTYWNLCRDLWKQCNCKQELKDVLYAEIRKRQKQRVSTTHYPWEVKITAFCLMNSKIL